MGNDSESEVIRRELDAGAGNPGVQVAEIVADIEDREVTDLTSIYGCVDGVLDNMLSQPPSPEAEMKVEFTYEGYRITIEQNGRVTFVRTE